MFGEGDHRKRSAEQQSREPIQECEEVCHFVFLVQAQSKIESTYATSIIRQGGFPDSVALVGVHRAVEII